jgi:hypothetical protein
MLQYSCAVVAYLCIAAYRNKILEPIERLFIESAPVGKFSKISVGTPYNEVEDDDFKGGHAGASMDRTVVQYEIVGDPSDIS